MSHSSHPFEDTIKDFSFKGGSGKYFSLPALSQKAGMGGISKLPVSIRIVLESVLRNCDGQRVAENDVKTLANWSVGGVRTEEIPFVVARVVLQDFTGVPLLVDLAAMRSAVAKMGKNPKMIEPLVPVDLVVDHSIQVDFSGTAESLEQNMEMEFERNEQRYQFMKWGMQAFDTFSVVPPGVGIVHQVNLEYLAKGVLSKDGVYYPDTLVGTDSHTTMINGMGIVGWGVGGIEAEAGMLGQPVYFLTPDVVGVNLTGALKPGVTATDLVLTITEMLRAAKVVGKFVEFHGEGAASLSLTDRATIANMAPEYGATMGFFPVDEESCKYLTFTGRTEAQVDAFRQYFKAQGLFGVPQAGELDYSEVLALDLASVEPSLAGPKRPQDRIRLADVKSKFSELLAAPIEKSGYAKTLPMADAAPPAPNNGGAIAPLRHGSVVIAAITSCTNTSNPSVMLAAGLVAKKAVEKGLTVPSTVKTSLGPGSRVVTEYLCKTGLQDSLDQLGFQTVGYGCTTCIGNSGPLHPEIEKTIVDNDLVVASVLSGNRNFEARVHQNVKANFLMSPPLVVAFALAGRVDFNPETEAIGTGKDGNAVYLRDIWPAPEEINALLGAAQDPEDYKKMYQDLGNVSPLWKKISAPTGDVYAWDEKSTYIQHPPYFENFERGEGVERKASDIHAARPLAILGDSVTTDHISPAAAIKKDSPAGRYLLEHGVAQADFNSYGSRRGNDHVMVRGTFANVRIKNAMVPGIEGGITKVNGTGEPVAIYDAAMTYKATNTPLIIFAGQEYGTGSSRDWAAKGTALQGVKAVITQSFERIHRSNLVGMGVLPCQFQDGENATTLGLDGTETFDLVGVENGITSRMSLTLRIHKADGTVKETQVTLRIDTPIEVEYYLHGGILKYVLRQLVAQA